MTSCEKLSQLIMQKILVLAANPKNTERLRLDEELREMDEGLRRATHRDQFELCQRHAVRARDIQRAMLDEMPQIVQFSGHGNESEGLIFEDEAGTAQLVPKDALAKLFELFSDPNEFSNPITCVVLNGCYSQMQAEAIAQHIPFVIGLAQSIENKQRIAFSIGFYDALGAGRSVEFAFNFACVAFEMADNTSQLKAPVLIRGTPTIAIPPVAPPIVDGGKTDKTVTDETLLEQSSIISNKPRKTSKSRWLKVAIAVIVLPIFFLTALTIAHSAASRFYKLGEQQYFEEGDLMGAKNSFNTALRLNPGFSEAHYNLALIYEDLSEFEKARAEYEKAMDAGSFRAFNNFARLQIIEYQDYEKATTLLLSAIQSEQRDRNDSELEYGLRKNIGWARLKQDQLSDAESELLKANHIEETLGGSRPDSYCLLAQVYEKQSRPDAAQTEWQTCRHKIFRPEDKVWADLADQALSKYEILND